MYAQTDSEGITFKAHDSKYDVSSHTLEEILAESKEDKDGITPEYHSKLEVEDDANKICNVGTIIAIKCNIR